MQVIYVYLTSASNARPATMTLSEVRLCVLFCLREWLRLVMEGRKREKINGREEKRINKKKIGNTAFFVIPQAYILHVERSEHFEAMEHITLS